MKISTNTLLRLACYASLAICFMPAVDYYCPWYITMLPALLVIGLSLRINQDIYGLLKALAYITGLAVVVLWFTRRKDPLVTFAVNFYITFLPALISIQLNKVIKDDTFFRDYLRVALSFVAVTCITTMIGHETYPMASRELASGTAVYDTEKYTKMNIGGYDFIYSLVLLIPVSLWQRKREKGIRKSWYTVVLVLIILCIYSSQYTIALICMVIAFLVIWIQKNPRLGLFACAVLILFLMINGLELLAGLFKWASQNIGSDYVKDRLLQVSQLLSGESVNSETSDARIQHYFQQLEAFAKSPILGHNLLSFNNDMVSGHSLVLDMMGAAGVFGTSLLLMLFRGLYRTSIPMCSGNNSRVKQGVWIVATIVAVLNPVTFPMTATVAFPCCMCMVRLENGEK